MGKLWSPVKAAAEMQDPIHEGGGGRGDVQRADSPPARQADQLVADRREAWVYGAEADAEVPYHTAAVVRAVVGHLGVGLGPVDPGLALLRRSEPIREVAHTSYPQVLDRPGRGLAHRRCDFGGASLREHHATAPGALGHPAGGAEVVRILDLVQGDDEGVLGLEQGVRLRVGVGLDLRADALVVRRAAALLYLELVDDPRLHVAEPDVVRRPLCREDSLYATLAAQGLANGVASVDDHASLLRDELRAVRRVASLPSLVRELLAYSVGALEVARGPGVVALAGEPHELLGDLVVAGLEQALEAESAQQLSEAPVTQALPRVDPPVPFGDPVEQHGPRLGSVEVVGQGVEEALRVRVERVGGRRVAVEPAEEVTHPLDRPPSVPQGLLRERHRLPVVGSDHPHHERVPAVLLDGHMKQPDVPDRLRHLLGFQLDHAVVHPDARQRPAARGLRLGDLVLVVREDEVRAAAVDLEVDAEDRLGHGRALDVPARPTLAPRGVPPGVFALLAPLPQREVLRRLLQLGGVVALALLHLLERPVGELPVAVERRDAEVDVAARLVGVPRLDERPDQLHDLADRLARLWFAVRPPQAKPVRVLDVGGDHVARQVLARHAALAGRIVDLVVHVGDVLDEPHLVALVPQEALEQPEDDERARVADVHPRVDRGPAGVDPDPAGLPRLERNDLPGERVVDADLTHARKATRVRRQAGAATRSAGAAPASPAPPRVARQGPAGSPPRHGGPPAARRSARRRCSLRPGSPARAGRSGSTRGSRDTSAPSRAACEGRRVPPTAPRAPA